MNVARFCLVCKSGDVCMIASSMNSIAPNFNVVEVKGLAMSCSDTSSS